MTETTEHLLPPNVGAALRQHYRRAGRAACGWCGVLIALGLLMGIVGNVVGGVAWWYDAMAVALLIGPIALLVWWYRLDAADLKEPTYLRTRGPIRLTFFVDREELTVGNVTFRLDVSTYTRTGIVGLLEQREEGIVVAAYTKRLHTLLQLHDGVSDVYCELHEMWPDDAGRADTLL